MPTYSLTLAPSVNSMFHNVPGRGRVKSSAYRRWIKTALNELLFQRAKAVKTPVSIEIFLPLGTRGDGDNRIKAVNDLLVRAGVIPDDSSKFVHKISVEYEDVPVMGVKVESV